MRPTLGGTCVLQNLTRGLRLPRIPLSPLFVLIVWA